jgi:molybdopterin synthase sulfur carrier subunit
VADGAVLTVVVRYFAAARAAAGVPEEKLTLPAPSTVSEVLRAAVTRHGNRLEQVLARCSYLLDEVAVHAAAAEATTVADGDALDVLPPFAGG